MVRAESVLEPVPGLLDFLAWVDSKGLKKAAVTNAPRENARVMLDALGLGRVSSLSASLCSNTTGLACPFAESGVCAVPHSHEIC